MNRRPIAITVVALLIVCAACAGMVVGFIGAGSLHPIPHDLIWIAAVDLTGIIAGVFLFLGREWARWLTLAWLAAHVAFSYFNSAGAAVTHTVIFAMIAYVLCRREEREYFRGPRLPDEGNRGH